jgi:CRP/FNR family transcriptional regulator
VTTHVKRTRHRHASSPNRFIAFADLTTAEIDALEHLGSDAGVYSRDQVIRHEGDPPEIFMLHQGWVASSASFDDGSRQVAKIHLPGDLMGAPSMGYTAAADTLTALTEVAISRVAPEAIARIFRDHPRLAMVFFLLAQEEQIILMERLMSVGRRRGVQRLAAFLLHIYDRLRLLDPACPLAFELPLTLEQLADVLGLHAVHVSRTLGRLERQGLIKRDHKRITLCNLEELRKQAGLPRRTIVRNPPWLPSTSCEV